MVGGDEAKGYAPDRKQYQHKIGLKLGIWYVFQRVKPYIHDSSPDVNHEHYGSSKQGRLVHIVLPLVIVCVVLLVFTSRFRAVKARPKPKSNKFIIFENFPTVSKVSFFERV